MTEKQYKISQKKRLAIIPWEPVLQDWSPIKGLDVKNKYIQIGDRQSVFNHQEVGEFFNALENNLGWDLVGKPINSKELGKTKYIGKSIIPKKYFIKVEEIDSNESPRLKFLG